MPNAPTRRSPKGSRFLDPGDHVDACRVPSISPGRCVEEAMTKTLPAHEDYAISIFGAGRRHPGRTLSALSAKGLGRHVDCENALTYAVDREWLPLHLGMVRLTAAASLRA